MYKLIFATLLAACLIAPVAGWAADKLPVKTIEQIFAEQAGLSNQHVRLSGKVVKVNNGIMGKNFLHIQDGTGSDADGTNDIVITSQQTANVGDEIEVEALVITNRDFGMGYSYQVILEEATLSAVAH